MLNVPASDPAKLNRRLMVFNSNVNTTTVIHIFFIKEPSDITPKGERKMDQKLDGQIYPKGKDGRSFQPNWLNSFEWIEYSKKNDAVYCYPCRQYAIVNASETFCTTGYNNWSKALAKGQGFSKHEISNSHLSAMLSWKEHSSRLASNQEISSLVNDVVLEKRQYYMKEIVSTVLFLVKNELPFRGNWNDEDSDESGLFQNLFKLLLEKDAYLRECQEAMPKNALYTSPQIQNELISVIADCLRRSIVVELNESSYLTLMADGTTDRNGNEICSIAFRHVVNGEPIETLLCFEQLDDKTAMGFFQVIVNRMEELGVDMVRLLLSQCYDGAAVMSGSWGGLQTLIQNHFHRKIPYIHCISHRLHLVVIEIVKNNENCRLFFDEIKLFHSFFSRFKVRQLYEGRRIPLIIEQRWSGHFNAIVAIKNNFDEVYNTLITIKEDTIAHTLDAADVAQAVGMLDSMMKKKFIFLLGFLFKLLGVIEPANQILQKREVGYRQAMPVIQAVKVNINAMRNDATFTQFLSEAEGKLDTIEYVPLRPRRIRQRSSRLSESVVMSTLGERDFDESQETTTLKRIYYGIIDKVIVEMDERFERNSAILNAVEAACDFLNDNFEYNVLRPLTELQVQLPSPEEFSVVKTYLLNERNKPEWQERTMLQSLNPVKSAFPNTYRLFEAIETFGATTSMNESSFSALSRIDTIRRSSMTNQRLRDLAFLGFEKKRLNSLNVDVILRKFMEKNRKIQLF